MGLPLYSATPKLPRDFPYQPEPKAWARFLAWESTDPLTEDDKNSTADGGKPVEELDLPEAEGRRMQRCNPGLKPCTRATVKDDKYLCHGFVRLRCPDTGHETIVHRSVVLEQSKWIRDRAAEPAPSTNRTCWREDMVEDALSAAPICIPSHIRWWHVLWAVDYMYEGRVPGFHLLAGEEWPARYALMRPRSIVWGLLELWEAGHFFGLDGLKERAEGAFMNYFYYGIDAAVADQCSLVDLGFAPASAFDWRRPQQRIGFEFVQAVWRLYGDPDMIPLDYFHMHMGEDGKFVSDLTAQDRHAVQEWARTVFDITDVQPIMMKMCADLSWKDLFELGWFQETVSKEGSTYAVEFRTALDEEMKASPDRWPMDEYLEVLDWCEGVQPEC
ncbi:hypothetical protein KVR01_011925 [Diaporthe batatas]|uniref:uncharacterized protein n=1 Tax=Diaporthe batatas TaxID=748121 RepID=UPI001D056CBB|nr:uncharacterized protein KVR01_011925 [Diaporthe batatas]KAG8158164.1 hypothetical protein KVR01_011925 [Diaporthe batatas]